MNNASLELGGTNWAEKEGSLLGYAVNDTNNKYSAKEFTFGRGTNLSATRIGQTGLIEKGRENLLLQSNQFDTTWLQNRIDLTSGQSGYDSDSDAWKLESNNASTTYLSQSVAASGVQTTSLYAKAGTADYFAYYTSSGVSAWFNLSNGSIGNTGSNIDAQIEDVGNGWYRCSMSYNASISYVRIYVTDVNGDFTSAIGANIYIQDAQVEQGLAASPYIPTTTTAAQAGVLENTPRLNYTTGVANPYLLLEPSRTNVFSQSEYYNGNWNLSNSSVANNQSTSPEGLINASVLSVVIPSQAGINVFNSWSDSTTYTMSAFVKKKIGSYIGFGLYGNTLGDNWIKWNLDNGTSTTNNLWTNANFEDYGNGWYRISATITTTTGNTSKSGFKLNPMISSSYSNGNVGDEVYIYGAQLEEGSYPTSYIPTYSTSATRAADTSSKADASGEINSTEGVLYAEIAALADDGTYRIFSLNDGTREERVYIQYKPTSNEISGVVKNGNVTQANISYVLSDETQYAKIAFKWKENDFAFWVNGVERGTDTSGIVPVGLSKLSFDQGNDSNYFFGKVNALQVYKEALTDTELATLTTI